MREVPREHSEGLQAAPSGVGMSKPTKAEKKAAARARRQRKNQRKHDAAQAVRDEADRREARAIAARLQQEVMQRKAQAARAHEEAVRAAMFNPHCSCLHTPGDVEHYAHRRQRANVRERYRPFAHPHEALRGPERRVVTIGDRVRLAQLLAFVGSLPGGLPR